MPLRGYKPLGGPKRNYRTPSGEVISRAKYDNIRAQRAGFKNRYELRTYKDSLTKSDWRNMLYDIRQKTGRAPTYQDYADIREVRQRRAKLKRSRTYKRQGVTGKDLDNKDKQLVAPDGPLARILDRSGRRPISGRPVGDS